MISALGIDSGRITGYPEEYQTVPMGNSDAIVEYEGKVEFIAAVLNTKKFANLGSHSLLDLLKEKERYAGSKANSFSVLFAEWRESQEWCANLQGVS